MAGVTQTYDPFGNLTSDGTRTFTYDTENRLLTETGPVTLALSYDPLGRLQQSVINGTTTQFLYDGDALVGEYPASGNTPLRRYVHGPGVDNPLIWYEGGTMTASNASYLITDRQGSTAGTVNTSGNVTATYTYDAYGAPNAWGTVGSSTRFRYTGQAAIPEAQLYYYKARVYDPVFGRFLQADPVGYGPDVNWYVYVGDDPVNSVDPTGDAGCTPTTGSNICSAAEKTQAKALADVRHARAGLRNLVKERAAIAAGKQNALSPESAKLEKSVQSRFGNSSNDAINGRIDPMLAGVEKVLSDPGSRYNFQSADIGTDLGRASVFGSTIKLGQAFLGANSRDREVIEVHEVSHKVGANFLVPELYERDALRAIIFSPYTLQNADNYGIFVYESAHK
ncbi:MAG: repeat protein [Caulobacteraceae bacterium]|nr:repeat protein [Caulobacteraceae bacterium]